MELSRLFQVIRSRWAIVLVVSLAGFAAGFGLTTLAAGQVDPLFQASIAIQFELSEDATIEELAKQIQSEKDIAVFAAQSLLLEYPGSSVFADTNAARLTFVAQGSSTAEAEDRVQSLVNAYLDADPNTGGEVSQQLADIERRAAELQAEIDSLEVTLTPLEESLKSQHELLDLKIARVKDAILALTVADAGATAEERTQNSEQIDRLEEELQNLQAEKSTLAPAPSEELNTSDRFRVDVLQRMMDFLELEYQRYALRSFGVTGSGGTTQPVGIQDLTPDPPSPVFNGAVGMFGGGILALFALVLTTRARKEIWLAEDLPVPLLGVVPSRKASRSPGKTWYDSEDSGQRKEAIQALRTSIEGTLDEPTTLLGIVGDGVKAGDCHTLGIDVATAFASAGQRVLVVGADYLVDAGTSEFSVGEPSLETLLTLPTGSPEALTRRVVRLLDEAIQLRPGLTVIPSGSQPPSATDSLAGQQFRVFLDEARSAFDLVVVIAGEAHSSAARVVAQRVGSVLIVVSPGRTTVPSVRSLVSDFNTQRVRVPGSVMISGSDSRTPSVPTPPAWAARSANEPEYSDPVDSPVSRLRFYPSPMEKSSTSASTGSLRTLMGDLSAAEGGSADTRRSAPDKTEDDLAESVLVALDNSTPAQAYEPVADYVVTRIEDILTAVSGQRNLSDELVEVVLQDGYIPLTEVRGHRTAGEWLVDELRWELENDQAVRVVEKFANLLEPRGNSNAESLNRWLTEEFFQRHVERTGGEPEVWHLSSEMGGLQVLVYGRRLNRERLTRMTTNLVRRVIDQHQRQLQQAQQQDDVEGVGRLEASLRDLHLFEVAIGMLQVGSSDEAKLKYPWRRNDQQPQGWVPIWTEGIRPNIAPLQRLGLLARPVLSDEELVAIQSAV